MINFNKEILTKTPTKIISGLRDDWVRLRLSKNAIPLNSLFIFLHKIYVKINICFLNKPYLKIIVHLLYVLLLSVLFNPNVGVAHADYWYDKTLSEIDENYNVVPYDGPTIFNRRNVAIPAQYRILPYYDPYWVYRYSILPWPTFPYPIFNPDHYFEKCNWILVNAKIQLQPVIELTPSDRDFLNYLSDLPYKYQAHQIVQTLKTKIDFSIDNLHNNESQNLKTIVGNAVQQDIARELWVTKTREKLRLTDDNRPLIYFILDELQTSIAKSKDVNVTDLMIFRHINAHMYLTCNEFAHYKAPGFLTSKSELYNQILNRLG